MAKRQKEPDNPLVETVKTGHRVLASLGLPHALLGGIAANLYRLQPRATQDVDFAVASSAAQTPEILESFSRAGWRAQAGRGHRESLRLEHESLPRIDLLVAGTPFEHSAITRASKVTIDDQELCIVTPEDLIVYKLIAGRAHDYEAVAAIIDAIRDLDEPYITGWLEQFGFENRWAQAVDEHRRSFPDE